MYNYNKEKGLQKGFSNGLQVDFISDLHLDFYCKVKGYEREQIRLLIEKFRDSMKIKNDKILVVAGDIADMNDLSVEFLQQVSEIWEYVLVIPGNHDFYTHKMENNDYSDLIKEMEHIENIVFLMDKQEIFEYEGIKIAGTIMFYNLNDLDEYVKWKSILNDKKHISREFINERNSRDIDYYNKVIHEVDVFVSHVPIVNLDGESVSWDTKNLFLNLDVNPIEEVLYVSGHTHSEKDSISTYSKFDSINVSYGYPSESEYKNDGIKTVFIEKE